MRDVHDRDVCRVVCALGATRDSAVSGGCRREEGYVAEDGEMSDGGRLIIGPQTRSRPSELFRSQSQLSLCALRDPL